MWQDLEYHKSKSIEQLHSSRWSDPADCLILLRHFPVKLEIPMCSAALVKKKVCFIIISNLAVITLVSVNNVRADLFLKGIFTREQRIKFAWWLEINLSLQNFKLLSIELTSSQLYCFFFQRKDYILKTIFESNGFPKSFVDICIKKYLDSFYKKGSSSESF